jgi:LysM domain
MPRGSVSNSRLGNVVRGVGALVLALVLVVGIPVALVRLIGWPLPTELPSLGEVFDSLGSSYISDTTLLKALACVCWFVWVQLVASLLIETFAYIRGRKAGRVPLAGGMQRAMAKLIATIALIGALNAARGSQGVIATDKPLTLPAPAEVTVATGPEKVHAKLAVIGDPSEAPAGTVPKSDPPVYVVQRYDSLWDIAERHLGDGFRWREIYNLNQGVAQADGTRLVDPDRIYTGWRLVLPPDAVNLPAGATTPTPAPPPPTASDPTGSSDLVAGMPDSTDAVSITRFAVDAKRPTITTPGTDR